MSDSLNSRDELFDEANGCLAIGEMMQNDDAFTDDERVMLQQLMAEEKEVLTKLKERRNYYDTVVKEEILDIEGRISKRESVLNLYNDEVIFSIFNKEHSALCRRRSELLESMDLDGAKQ